MSLKTKIKLALLDNLVWVLLAAFFIANAFFTPAFLGMKNQLNILYQSATLGLLVLGMGIVMMVGELDLSMEATLAFAPGIVILAARQLNMGPVTCILLTLVLGTVIGFFNGFFVAKLKTNSFLLTMSSQIVMRGLVLFLVPFSLAGLDKGYTFLGRGRIGAIQIAILVLIVVYIIFEFIFHKTVFGRKFTLTGGNRRAAYISGINTDRVVIYAFMLAGLLSALAGLVTAGRQNAVSNSMGEGMVMMAFAGAILGGCSFNGGMGKPVGMLGGTLLLGMIDNALNLNGVDVNLVSATKGGLIFLAILLDRLRFKMSADIMHKENVRKLSAVQSNS
ncbi:ABC transporter permease [Faecalispora sporosphaeroides]|uniref:ABC transporter permease n=1 Tax=Faecalispora sporosphaeroides TaxID=1549 RepID=UPI00036A2F7C|nr:ABC transporter permease [Faecalispora sporosphaeroides]